MNRALALSAVVVLIGFAVYLASGPASPPPSRPAPRADNVVFVLIDTLRADHLSCYGYERPTSPNIDRIAEQGIRFEHVFSVSDWTNPTIVSLFTGHYPQAVFPPAKLKEAIRLALPTELPSLAELLQAEGYHTVGLVDHPGITRRLGFARGFDDYTQLYAKEGLGQVWGSTSAEFIQGEFDRALDEMGERPFFIYLHLVYPHSPYKAPAPYAEMFGPHEKTRRKEGTGMVSYDAEIRFTDELIGSVFDSLAGRGLLESTYFIVTSDHGEGFSEHGRRGHGKTFYNEVVRVPLIMLPPGGRRSEPALVTAPVSNIDLFPTVATIAGADLPDGLDGEPLFRFFGPDDAPTGPLFSESPHSYDIEGRAVIDGPLKYIYTPLEADRTPAKARRLYDWRADPDERNNLAGTRQDAAERLHGLLEDHRRDVEMRRSRIGALTSEPDPETLERLRALGYVGR